MKLREGQGGIYEEKIVKKRFKKIRHDITCQNYPRERILSTFCLLVGSKETVLLVEPPLNRLAANVEGTKQLHEHLFGAVNGFLLAAHALVANSGLNRLAAVADGDGFATEGVAVGLGAHQEVRDSNNVFGMVLAGVIVAAGAETHSVVGQVTMVRSSGCASATAAAAALDRGDRLNGLLRGAGGGGDRLRSLDRRRRGRRLLHNGALHRCNVSRCLGDSNSSSTSSLRDIRRRLDHL